MSEFIDYTDKAIKERKDAIAAQENEIAGLNAEIAELEAHKEKLCCAILLDAIIVGIDDFRIRHGMIAPYAHGYEIRKLGVSCSGDWMTSMPKLLYKFLTEKKGWETENFKQLKDKVAAKWDELPADYNPDTYVPSKEYLHGNHIANGYETDGFFNIVAGRCGGTYSSMTTATQNELSKQLVVLRGFCPDGYRFVASNSFSIEKVAEIYNRHGLDSNLSDLDEWAKRNPTRCMADKKCFVPRND